ncbi:MAG: alpha/beta fold hydrolase [Persicimonas sp.]
MEVQRPQVGRPDWLPQALYPFENHYLEVEGSTVHYVDEGDGPPLLMLHGNPTWSFLYRNLITSLRQRFRCVALDYPGFGLSLAADGYSFRPREHARVVEQVVEALGLSEIVLMAHDWGGPIGLWAAQRQPERYSGFVLSNTFAWPVEGSRRLEGFSRVMGSSLGGALERRTHLFVNVGIRLGTRDRLSHEVMRCYRRPFAGQHASDGPHIFARELTASRDFLAEVEQGLEHLVDHPALLVWGEFDLAFGTDERMRFEEYFPGHEVVLLEGARHFIQEDEPEAIVAGIGEWADLALTHFC